MKKSKRKKEKTIVKATKALGKFLKRISKKELIALIDEVDGPIYTKNIENINAFSVRAQSYFKRMGIGSIKDLTEKSFADLLAVKGFGKKTALEVEDVVRSLGYKLRE